MEIVRLDGDVATLKEAIEPFAAMWNPTPARDRSLQGLGSPSVAVFRAIEDERCLGSIWCKGLWVANAPNPVGWRELFIGVEYDVRKRGIGTQLVRHLIGYAANDPAIVGLAAVPVTGRPAIVALLRSCGFAESKDLRPTWMLRVGSST